jgi:hypothetical protein
MPGSPPMSTRLPATRPPPNTRSNSPTWVEARSSSTRSTLSIGTGVALVWLIPRLGPVPAAETTSSTKLSHWPHSVQRPSHLGDWYPHFWQLKSVLADFFAMPAVYPNIV